MFQLVPNCPKKVRTFGGVPASQNFHDFPFQDGTSLVTCGPRMLMLPLGHDGNRSEAMMITKTFVMLSRWAIGGGGDGDAASGDAFSPFSPVSCIEAA